MATHSSILAWRVPWTEEPDGLLSMGSHRVGHDWRDLACMHALEKGMATHSSILVWRIPGMEEPGGLPSMGSHRVRRDWSNLAAAVYILEFLYILCILYIHSIQSIYHLDIQFANLFSLSVNCLFILLMMSLEAPKFLIFTKSNLSFATSALGITSNKSLPISMLWSFWPMFPSKGLPWRLRW